MLPFPEIEKIAEPPVPITDGGHSWPWWAAAVALGLVALGLLIWLGAVLWRRCSVPLAPARPEKLAMRELKALRKRADGMSAPEFGGALAGVIRSFLHRRLGVLAHFSTTPEILGRAPSLHAPPPPLTDVFAGVLEACDALKFGAGAPRDRAALMAEAEAALEKVSRTLAGPPPAPPVSVPPPLSSPTTAAHDSVA